MCVKSVNMTSHDDKLWFSISVSHATRLSMIAFDTLTLHPNTVVSPTFQCFPKRRRVHVLPAAVQRFFFFKDTATTEIYTLSLHDALPICGYLSPAIRPNNDDDSDVGRSDIG